jgi:hypothetical protein
MPRGKQSRETAEEALERNKKSLVTCYCELGDASGSKFAPRNSAGIVVVKFAIKPATGTTDSKYACDQTSWQLVHHLQGTLQGDWRLP